MRRRIAGLTAALLTALLAGTIVGVPAAQAATSIDADIVTVDPHINQTLKIQGTVTPAPTLPEMVTVTRTDSSGSTPLDPVPVTEDPDHPGSWVFDVSDTPPVRGSVTYHLALMSDSTVSVDLTVYVTGLTATVSASTPDRVVRTGRTVTVTGRITGGPPAALMYLFATPYQRDRDTIKSAPVGADGTLSGTYTVTRRTTFRAAFRGDQTYEPSYDLVLVKARGHVTNRLGGGYATRNGYRLYGPNAEPPLYGHLRPERRDACLYYEAQRRYLGAWHTVEASGCVRTDGDGRTVRVLEGNHVLDTPYRVRVEWHGNTAWLRDNGPWLKLMFRRR